MLRGEKKEVSDCTIIFPKKKMNDKKEMLFELVLDLCTCRIHAAAGSCLLITLTK